MSLRNILTKKKRNANALYSVLNNIDTLEAAYKTASTSQGSAQKEMENFSKSIEFSLGRLSASWQEFQANLLNSQLVKDVVDIGNVVVNVLDKITTGLGGIIPLLTTIGGIIIDAKSGKFGDNFVNDIINGLVKSTTLDTSVISTIMDIPSEYIQKAVKLNELQDELDQFREEYNSLITEEAQEISNVFIDEVHDNIPTLQEMVDEVGMGDLNDYISKSSDLSSQEISQTESISETTKALQKKREELLQNISNTEAEIETIKTDMASEESYNEVINMNTYQKKLNELASKERAATIANEVLAEKQYSIAEEQATRDIIAENLAEGDNTIAVMENTAAKIRQKITVMDNAGTLTNENRALMENTARLLENRAAALKAQQASSGFGNVLKNLVTQGLTYAAFWAIGKVISFIGEKIHEATHAVEIAAEKAKEARKQIDDINKSFKETSKTTNDIKQRYAELAQGVQNLGTAFQSQGNLSTDEYEEFLDLSNQLAELYPSLTQGYTENGDAILSLSGSVDTIVGSLDNLIDRSKTLARLEIDEQMTNVWVDNMNTINQAQKDLLGGEELRYNPGEENVVRDKIKGYKDTLKDYEALYKQINNSPSKNVDNLISRNIYNDLVTEFEELYPELSGKFFEHLNNSGRANFGVLGPEGLEQLRGWLQGQIQEYSDLVQQAEDKIAQVNAEMQSQLITYLSGDLAYTKLDKDKQLVVNSILSNFDMSNLPDDVDSWEKLTEWYHNNIINAIGKIDDKDIQESLVKLFSGEGTYSEAQNLYEIIYNYLKEQPMFNPKDPLVVYLQAELEEQGENISKAAAKLTNNVDKQRKASYGKFWNDWLGKQSDEFVSWVQNDLVIPDNVIYTTQELLDLYDEWINRNKEINETSPVATISDSIKQLSTQVDPYFDEIGSFYQKIFDIVDGNNVQNDIYNPENFAKLDNDTLNSLRSTFEEISEEVGVAFDPSIVDNFWHELENATNSKEAHAAIDSLVTQWLDATDTIKNINDDTANYVKVQLSNWGIINADEVVQSRLELNNADKEAADIMKEITPLYEELQQEKENLNSANIAEREQAKARIPLIEQEILERYKEVEATEATRISLFQLALLEEGISLNNINSATDVQQILAIAQACGITSKALSALQNFENNIATLGANGMDTNAMNGMRQMYINQFAEELDPSNLMKDAKADWTEAAKDVGGSAGKEAVDAYQEQLDVLKWLYDNDKIDVVFRSNTK